jgi:DNA excision repair protein ERCC-2
MQYVVAVRTLCEFTARRGDLDLRFTPAPSALEGIAGHQLVTGRRGPAYETEVTLRGEYDVLTVRGRADGYDPLANRVEEIKTHRGDLARQPANHRALHWAQARVYGWLLCQARALPAVELALVYFDVATQQETTFTQTHSAADLRSFFERCCRDFLDWARRELAHRSARDAALAALAFPHPSFRSGQRAIAQAVYQGVVHRRCVLAQAPTGIGKTVGTLFGMLKAAPAQAIDKVFYLTAKSTGRQLALDAAASLGTSGAVRVLELTARDKACEHRDKACHGESCPLARGFHDRLAAARDDAVGQPRLDRATVRAVALRHQVCPYYLGQELARWADLLVGDFNHFFDGSALLHAMAVTHEWKVGVLADEAHNLVERARAMYSAGLDQDALRAVGATAPAPLRPAFGKLGRSWRGLRQALAAAEGAPDALPTPFLQALKQAATALEAWLAQAPPSPQDAPLQQAYFDLLAFLRLAESFSPAHSVLELDDEAAGTRLRIQNLVPAPFLKPRFRLAHSATLFSATLGPARYFLDMLGLPEDTACIDVASPFRPEQLQVQLVSDISTRYTHRQRSVAPIVRLIAAQYAARPGNYLAFFSSFDYLAQVATEFALRHPATPAWCQDRGMAEGDRQGFLDRFVAGGRGVGFAVLGGSFGEGIDLRGDRLVGAFVATLGLPQVNPRNEQLKACLERAFGAGWDYTYLYPGLQKVVQAAGRVIRTEQDEGVVYLIDDRFARREVRALLPAWWDVRVARAAAHP